MAKSSFTTINNTLPCPGRRGALRASLHAFLGLVGLPSMALKFSGAQANSSATSISPPSAKRLALLIGNGDYPVPHDLPPIQKNVTDMAEVLALRGFDVSQAMNLDEASLQTTVSEFVKRVAAAPRDAVTLFYYAGHGLQVDSNNLLLGSGSNPTAPRKDLLARSLVLQQKLLAALPSRPEALNITVIDACRTDLRNAFGDGEGLNQVEAPLGSMVCFSTGAGRPAVSPDNPNQNTFYTASLIKLLRESADHITFNDLFRMVKADVEQTMLNHPLGAIRQLAQYPFIADNAKVQVPLAWHSSAGNKAQAVKMSLEEEAEWQLIQGTVWPIDLLKRCREFQEKYPNSPQASSVVLYQTGAADALRVLRSKQVKLFKTSFVVPELAAPATGNNTVSELNRAARGDKDAAARIARLHRQLDTEQAMLRYVGWLQYASGLGNGIASYELALRYRESDQPLLAAQAEARARQLGYSPPPSLGHERK